MTTGDNVYEQGEPELFAAQLDEPYEELRPSRPLWVTLGNHDVAGAVTYVVTGGGGRQLYPLDGCATGSSERVAGQVRHHFTAVEVHDGALAVIVLAEDDTVLGRAVIRR